MNEEAGQRLRRFVDERMAARGVGSIIELADTADIGRDTLYAWFRGREPTPRPGGKVAAILGVSYRELLGAYEGHKETPPGGDQTALVEAIDRQTEMLRQVLMALAPIPPDSMEAEAREEWAGAERRVSQDRLGSTTPPRTPAPESQPADTAGSSRRGEPS